MLFAGKPLLYIHFHFIIYPLRTIYQCWYSIALCL